MESIKKNLDTALKKNKKEDSESDDNETDELDEKIENDDDYINFLRYYNELLIRLT